VGNVNTNVYAKFHCTLLRIKKVLWIFRELITTITRTTTRVAYWDPPSGSNNNTEDLWHAKVICISLSDSARTSVDD